MESVIQANKVPGDASLIAAMQAAWSDHQHSRNQTWNTVTTVVALAVGMVAVDQKFNDPVATSIASVPVLIMAALGMLIARHHRKYQIRKFATHHELRSCARFAPDGWEICAQLGGVLHFADAAVN